MKESAIQIAYEIFSSLLLEDKVYLDGEVRFSSICKWMGFPEKELDAYIFKEMGLSGREIIDSLRTKEPDYLAKKYGDRLAALKEALSSQNGAN